MRAQMLPHYGAFLQILAANFSHENAVVRRGALHAVQTIVMKGEEDDMQHVSPLISTALAVAQQLTLAGDEDACSTALDIVYAAAAHVVLHCVIVTFGAGTTSANSLTKATPPQTAHSSWPLTSRCATPNSTTNFQSYMHSIKASVSFCVALASNIDVPDGAPLSPCSPCL